MRLVDKKDVLTTRPFVVEEVRFEYKDLKPDHPYYRLKAPDWINVLPILADGRAVLIEQPRIGSMTEVLETPGGMVDPGERDFTLTASRELEEETGLMSQRILNLGSFNPNPAIMTNTCHFFLAMGCVPCLTRKHHPDADERITTKIVDVSELDFLVRTRQINHALSALCIMLAQKYLEKKT